MIDVRITFRNLACSAFHDAVRNVILTSIKGHNSVTNLRKMIANNRNLDLVSINSYTVIFLPARPASQTHDSHKGRMILNHVNPAGRIKNCGEKSAFKNLQLLF